ncbi:MAG: peptidylprolyl isomerase [candidate division Zixibacteria bacterium]|nr:peptidylprolyl isomerase [candidate division Zixibacteria bacterium]
MQKARIVIQLVTLGLFSLSLSTNSNAFLFSSKNKDIAAKVNGEIITREDFKKKLESLDFVTKDNKAGEQKTKRDALETLITDRLVEQKAKKLDVNQDEVWKQKQEKYSLEYLLDLMFRKDIIEKVQVQDSEITAFYNENREKLFNKPEQFKVSHILIEIKTDTLQKGNSKKAKQAEKEAETKAFKKIESIYERAKNGEDFAALARQFSEEDGSRDKGGELGFLPRGRMLKEFEDQLTTLQPNEVSKPFKTKFGYHILKYTDEKPAELVELNKDTMDRIRLALTKDKQKKKAEEYVSDLKKGTDYVFNEEVLNQNPDSVEDDPWVLIIDDKDTTRFLKYKGELNPYKQYLRKNDLTLEDKKKLLTDNISLFNLLILQARKEGYDTLPEYVNEINNFRMKEARLRVRREGTLQGYIPSDAEVYDYYVAHRSEYPPDSSIHVYHIIFSDSLKAEEVLKRIKDGADFVEMAKEYYPGEKEIRDVAYDLGFISDKDISAEFYKTAAQLKEGEVGGPVKSDWGYHLIKVVERRSGSPMELYKSKIKNLVFNEKASKLKAEWEKKLRDGQQIWINEKLVKNFKFLPGK